MRAPITLRIKEVVATILFRLGGLRLYQKHILKKNAFVLTYHRVLPSLQEVQTIVQPGMYVLVDTFRSHLRTLKENYNVLPLEELISRSERGLCLRNCCALTLDDGWLDNFTYAFPILQEYHIPATIFLATNHIGTNRLFWPEEFAFYLKNPAIKTAFQHDSILGVFLNDIGGADEDETSFDYVIRALKQLPPYKRENLLQDIRAIAGEWHVERQLMNWKEVLTMQASGLISFGAHTANHVILDQVPFSEAKAEIVSSLDEIERRIGVRPEFFAYPNGNNTDELQTFLRHHGIRGAVTTKKGWFRSGTSLFNIPRIGIHEDISRTISLLHARILLRQY